MVSMQSVRNLIDEARGQVLVLLQDGDREVGVSDEWAYNMSEAYDKLLSIRSNLDQAELAG